MEAIRRIIAHVHARTGHDFSQYKRSTLLRRIQRRMQIHGLSTLETYLDYLRKNPTEASALFNDILIGVTSFFRDRESWQELANQVIPQIFNGKETADMVRAWTIGCSTGEEAYGLAILLFEQADKLEIRPQIQVFASDLDENSIKYAREGCIPQPSKQMSARSGWNGSSFGKEIITGCGANCAMQFCSPITVCCAMRPSPAWT